MSVVENRWARWCDEEYGRMAARRFTEPRSRESLLNEGRMSMLAELAAALRNGHLPQHCPVRSDDLRRQAAIFAGEWWSEWCAMWGRIGGLPGTIRDG